MKDCQKLVSAAAGRREIQTQGGSADWIAAGKMGTVSLRRAQCPDGFGCGW